MDDVLKHWGLSKVTITELHKSAHNSTWDVGGKYVLKHNPDTKQLDHAIYLANRLLSEGVPLAAYIKTLNGEYTTPDGAYCLMEKLKGAHVVFYDNPRAIQELGRGLARLHAALSNIEPEIQCNDSNLLDDWYSWIKPKLVDVNDEVIEQTEARLNDLYKQLPRQLIHRDVHSHNVLFDNGVISGWLDFDLNQVNIRIFDLAYLLAGLLIGKTGTSTDVESWKTLYRDLLMGYNKINKLTDVEVEMLPVMMTAIELLFVAHWNINNNDREAKQAAALAEFLYNEVWIYG